MDAGSGPHLERKLDTDDRGRIVVPADYSAADLHCHSSSSDGLFSVEHIRESAARRGIRAIAITDHDMIGGALAAQSDGGASEIVVVVGQEITTRWQHHIVGLFMEKPVSMFRKVRDTVMAIRDQGGLAIVAHPELGLPSSASRRALLGWMEDFTFDGIEIDSPYLATAARRRLLDFYQDHAERLGAAIGGTDAHFDDVGRIVTLFKGTSAEDLRRAIESRTTLVARTNLQFSRPSWGQRLTNQRRSLLWLPLYRMKALVTGRYS